MRLSVIAEISRFNRRLPRPDTMQGRPTPRLGHLLHDVSGRQNTDGPVQRVFAHYYQVMDVSFEHFSGGCGYCGGRAYCYGAFMQYVFGL